MNGTLSSSLPYFVMLPLVAAFFAGPVYRRMQAQIGWLIAAIPLSLTIYFSRYIFVSGVDGPTARWEWVPLLDIGLTFSLNGLGLLMALLISGLGFLVVFYSIYYMSEKEDLGKFYTYILLFMGAMLGVVASDNLIGLFVFWELTSVSSFLLIGFWHGGEESRAGALKALMITVFGGMAMLVGLILLGIAGGTYEFSALAAAADAIQGSMYYIPIVILLLIGAFTKSAQAPFHIWLPGAMAAPTPVSAYLHSATMVKAGLFITAKFSLILGGTPLWYYSIAAVGAATVFLGALMAIRQRDLKALLAFSTVSQLGLIIPMFALGTHQAAAAGGAHMLNHATFKGALFLLVGIIDHQTGTRRIDQLSGLARRMPMTAVLTVIAALSMAGVWPFNGFVSKELIFEALLTPPFGPNFWTHAFTVMTVAGSVLTTVYCLILAHRIHFGAPSGAVETARDPRRGMLAAPGLLVIAVIVLGLYPAAAQRGIVDAAASAISGVSVRSGLIPLIPGIGAPLFMSLTALVVGILVYVGIGRIGPVLSRIETPVHGNMVYAWILGGLERLSARLVDVHMTGFLRDYVVYILTATVLVVGYVLWATRALAHLTLDLAPVSPAEIIVLTAISMAAFLVVRARRRLVAVAGLGLIGIMITLLYVMLRAPDLALTQFLVEAVGIVLILLALRRLPPLQAEAPSKRKKAVDMAVAIGSGLMVALLALVANGSRMFSSISEYYVKNSVPLGGGTNIVNVILVDFRGFDTMGEITVLAIAGLSVAALVRLRRRRKGSK